MAHRFLAVVGAPGSGTDRPIWGIAKVWAGVSGRPPRRLAVDQSPARPSRSPARERVAQPGRGVVLVDRHVHERVRRQHVRRVVLPVARVGVDRVVGDPRADAGRSAPRRAPSRGTAAPRGGLRSGHRSRHVDQVEADIEPDHDANDCRRNRDSDDPLSCSGILYSVLSARCYIPRSGGSGADDGDVIVVSSMGHLRRFEILPRRASTGSRREGCASAVDDEPRLRALSGAVLAGAGPQKLREIACTTVAVSETSSPNAS